MVPMLFEPTFVTMADFLTFWLDNAVFSRAGLLKTVKTLPVGKDIKSTSFYFNTNVDPTHTHTIPIFIVGRRVFNYVL